MQCRRRPRRRRRTESSSPSHGPRILRAAVYPEPTRSDVRVNSKYAGFAQVADISGGRGFGPFADAVASLRKPISKRDRRPSVCSRSVSCAQEGNFSPVVETLMRSHSTTRSHSTSPAICRAAKMMRCSNGSGNGSWHKWNTSASSPGWRTSWAEPNVADPRRRPSNKGRRFMTIQRIVERGTSSLTVLILLNGH